MVAREPAIGRPVAFAAVTVVVARPGVARAEVGRLAEGTSTEVRIRVRVRARARVKVEIRVTLGLRIRIRILVRVRVGFMVSRVRVS